MSGAATASRPSGRRAGPAPTPPATTPSPGATNSLVTPARWPDAGRRLLGVPLGVVLWVEVLLAAAAVAAVRRDAVSLTVAGLLSVGTAAAVLVRPRGTPLHRLATTW